MDGCSSHEEERERANSSFVCPELQGHVSNADLVMADDIRLTGMEAEGVYPFRTHHSVVYPF